MNPRTLDPAAFTYALPPERIALHPTASREHSRLLVRHPEGHLSHHAFSDVTHLLPANALLVLNHTRVIQARLAAQKATGGQVELFLLEPASGPRDPAVALQARSSATWSALLGGKKLTPGTRLRVVAPVPFWAEVLDKQGAQGTVRLSWDGAETLGGLLEQAGQTPLPPYLKRAAEPADRDRYQTVYAQHGGSVAAPTAGLHFTPSILGALQGRGVQVCQLTLHVGAGTFRPMEGGVVGAHTMHQERFDVTVASLRALRDAHVAGRPVVAVGTTSLRTLESLYVMGVRCLQGRALPGGEGWHVGQWESADLPVDAPDVVAALDALLAHVEAQKAAAVQGETQIMLAPGCRIRVAHALVTNFHQPGTTLLLLVAAVVGHPAWLQVYQTALDGPYRFLSYGDSSLLWVVQPPGG